MHLYFAFSVTDRRTLMYLWEWLVCSLLLWLLTKAWKLQSLYVST